MNPPLESPNPSETNIISLEDFRPREQVASSATTLESPLIDDAASSTALRETIPPAQILLSEIANLVTLAEDIVFEDGMRNPVADAVERIILVHGVPALDALQASYSRGDIPATTMEEILLWLGAMEDAHTYEDRFSMFVFFITEKDIRVKEAAGTALAAIGDPRSVAFLRREANNNAVPPLIRQEFLSLAEELFQTHTTN